MSIKSIFWIGKIVETWKCQFPSCDRKFCRSHPHPCLAPCTHPTLQSSLLCAFSYLGYLLDFLLWLCKVRVLVIAFICFFCFKCKRRKANLIGRMKLSDSLGAWGAWGTWGAWGAWGGWGALIANIQRLLKQLTHPTAATVWCAAQISPYQQFTALNTLELWANRRLF